MTKIVTCEKGKRVSKAFTPALAPITDKDRLPLLPAEDQQVLRDNQLRVRKIRRDIAKAANSARGREAQEVPAPRKPKRAPPAPRPPASDPADDKPDFEIDTWVDAKDFHAVRLAKRKVKLADVELQTAEAKRDVELGLLIPRAQVDSDHRDMCEEFEQALSALVDLVSMWVAPDKIIQAQSAFRDLADAKLLELSKAAQ